LYFHKTGVERRSSWSERMNVVELHRYYGTIHDAICAGSPMKTSFMSNFFPPFDTATRLQRG